MIAFLRQFLDGETHQRHIQACHLIFEVEKSCSRNFSSPLHVNLPQCQGQVNMVLNWKTKGWDCPPSLDFNIVFESLPKGTVSSSKFGAASGNRVFSVLVGNLFFDVCYFLVYVLCFVDFACRLLCLLF